MGLNIHQLNLTNPPDEVYFALVNTMRDVFNNDYESVLMPEAIKNARVLFFQSQSEVETVSNCAFNSGNLELSTQGDIQKDACDSISGYVEDASKDFAKGVFSLNTSSENYKEGSGSIDMNANAAVAGKNYGIYKTISSQDWGAYTGVKVWVKSTHSDSTRPDIHFYFRSGGTWHELAGVTLSQGVNEVVFNISSYERASVTEYGFYLHLNDAEDFHAYVDDIRVTSTNYVASGYVETSTSTFSSDVARIFLLERVADLPASGTRTIKVSLDETNWRTIGGGDFEEWLDVSGWSEMTTKDKLRIRVELTTNSSSETPEYDDLLVAYKLKVA